MQITENIMNRWILGERIDLNIKRQVEINILIEKEVTEFIWLTKTHPYLFKGFHPFSSSANGDIIGCQIDTWVEAI